MTTRSITTIRICWDALAPEQPGWAYEFEEGHQVIETGVLNGPVDDLDGAIRRAIDLAGLDISLDEFAAVSNATGGWACWGREVMDDEC